MKMKRFISAAASVNIGKLRENNEDNLYFNGVFLTEATRERPGDFEAVCGDARQVYAVCDGMGGEQLGELASLLTVESLHSHAGLLKEAPETELEAKLERFIREANGLVCEVQRSRGTKRIGTTLAMVAVDGKSAHLYNIGDSRIYLFRKNRLEQFSEDHTATMRLVRLGNITPEQAKTHPQRNSLTQFVGIDEAEMVIEAHKSKVKMKNGDVFMLCSDGLTDMVEEAEISRILAASTKPAEAARRLVEAALSREGRDNITVIILAYRRKIL